MQPLRQHRGLVVPLLRRDIDTDQIIPKQFLKSVERAGFGRHLFHDWRVRADGTLEAGFVLNQAKYTSGSVLVTGPNFGCGSSREHAAWALIDFGFRVVIAPSFADIFRQNAIVNGLLPVQLPEARISRLAADAAARECWVDVDLDACCVRDDRGAVEPFAIEPAARHRLLHGLDDIALILQHEIEISRYEDERRVTSLRCP
jgi:3-isopropylmalate/(R)-2-methylmalate dehydratase small subunit